MNRIQAAAVETLSSRVLARLDDPRDAIAAEGDLTNAFGETFLTTARPVLVDLARRQGSVVPNGANTTFIPHWAHEGRSFRALVDESRARTALSIVELPGNPLETAVPVLSGVVVEVDAQRLPGRNTRSVARDARTNAGFHDLLTMSAGLRKTFVPGAPKLTGDVFADMAVGDGGLPGASFHAVLHRIRMRGVALALARIAPTLPSLCDRLPIGRVVELEDGAKAAGASLRGNRAITVSAPRGDGERSEITLASHRGPPLGREELYVLLADDAFMIQDLETGSIRAFESSFAIDEAVALSSRIDDLGRTIGMTGPALPAAPHTFGF